MCCVLEARSNLTSPLKLIDGLLPGENRTVLLDPNSVKTFAPDRGVSLQARNSRVEQCIQPGGITLVLKFYGRRGAHDDVVTFTGCQQAGVQIQCSAH